MTIKRQKGFKALAVFVAFAIAQISLQLSFAAPAPPVFTTLVPQGFIAKVTTKGGQPVSINGISSPSGSSVATNAIVETPAGVEATIDLGPLGTVTLLPGSKLGIQYECPDGNPDTIDPEKCKATYTLFAGCVVVNYNKNTRHQVDTDEQKKVAESDKEKEKNAGGVLNFCKGAPIAGLSSGGVAGLGWPLTIALLGAALVIPPAVVLLTDDETTVNPSPVTP